MIDKLIYDLPNEPQGMGAFDSDQNDTTSKREINLKKIDNIEFDDIDHNDYPDFCDAFIYSADMNGYPMTEEELDDLNENYREFVYEKLFDYLY